jgi:hypothetical protein
MKAAANNGDRTLHNALVRLEVLTEALERVADSKARETAREMLELMLDLHGLALARLTAMVAAAPNGHTLFDALTGDPNVCAILLLHGLHPHDARVRLDRTIADKQPQWAERGFQVNVLGIDNGVARVSVYKNGSAEPADELCREVEELLSEAAPDLDDIVVEIEVAGAA